MNHRDGIVGKTATKKVSKILKLKTEIIRLMQEMSPLVDGRRVLDVKIAFAPQGRKLPDGAFESGNVRYYWINDTREYLAITYEKEDPGE